ncbi:MAG: uracil-DNA glycosylase family protein [Prevotella sp.]|nr:uracil-DNA glycosylase family protein [Prevotella sp.]
MRTEVPLECHPWQPFLPEHTRVLMLGSFPPSRQRWSMDFFYPNYINDMWRIFGLCLYGDAQHFVDSSKKTFRLDDIKAMLQERGVGLYDTARVVRRTKNTASDKDLEVVEAVDLVDLLGRIPACRAVVTTGQKATDLFTAQMGIPQPKVGGYVEFAFPMGDMGGTSRTLRLYRMPSSSRAYPMRLDRKAAFYQPLFDQFLSI